MSKIVITSKSIDETLELGRKLGQNIMPGTLVSLVGNLGAGKTHLIKGIAEGLEVPDVEDVTSPTFTLIKEYQGRLPIYHMDLYRLGIPVRSMIWAFGNTMTVMESAW